MDYPSEVIEQTRAMKAAQARANAAGRRIFVHVDSKTGRHFSSGMEYVGPECVFVGFADPQ